MVPRYAFPLTRIGITGLAGLNVIASTGANSFPPELANVRPSLWALTCHVSPAGIVATLEPSGSVMVTVPTELRLLEADPTARPTRISASRDVGEGALIGSRPDRDPDVQLLARPAATRAATRQRPSYLAPIVPKLQLDFEVLSFQECNHGLELVA
jgi:hypothetical protein